jgi:hypothetical protein
MQELLAGSSWGPQSPPIASRKNRSSSGGGDIGGFDFGDGGCDE